MGGVWFYQARFFVLQHCPRRRKGLAGKPIWWIMAGGQTNAQILHRGQQTTVSVFYCLAKPEPDALIFNFYRNIRLFWCCGIMGLAGAVSAMA